MLDGEIYFKSLKRFDSHISTNEKEDKNKNDQIKDNNMNDNLVLINLLNLKLKNKNKNGINLLKNELELLNMKISFPSDLKHLNT